MEKENDYLVRNTKRIVEHLSTIFKSNCIVSAHFGENNSSFLTAIIEIDPKGNVLKVDCAPSELLNKLLLGSSKVLFRTQIDGIKVSFSGKNIKKSKCKDQPAFEMPIPDAIFWMQRRNYFRVKVPLSHTGSNCEVRLLKNIDSDIPTLLLAGLRLADISIKGFALLNSDPLISDDFEIDKEFNDCKLQLHEGPSCNVSFVVKNLSNIKINASTNQQRIGCRLTDLTPTFESAIQRYMQDIERQLKSIG